MDVKDLKKGASVLVVDELPAGVPWTDDPHAELPGELLAGQKHGLLPEKFKAVKVQVSVRELPDGKRHQFKAKLTDTLRQVFEQGAQELGKPLLPPPPAIPLDTLLCHKRGGDTWSEPLTELDRPLWLALAQGCTRRFGITYVLAIKINTKWGIAPSEHATPRELLTNFGFDPAQFSLYRANSADLLPPDMPVAIPRGDMFEAQKDGRYGSAPGLARPIRGSQTIEDDIAQIKEAGYKARLLNIGEQKYVEVSCLKAPTPPWHSNSATILIAMPVTYPIAGLDAFYLELPFGHSSGSIPYQSQVANLDGRNWALISWHYASNRQWEPRHDDLASHIEHCRGFFLRRGVTQ